MERDIPVALVGDLGWQQLAIKIIQFDVHLHIKINKHVAEFHVDVAAQYLKSTLIKYGSHLLDHGIIVRCTWLKPHLKAVHGYGIQVLAVGKLVEVVILHIAREDLGFTADEWDTLHLAARCKYECFKLVFI